MLNQLLSFFLVSLAGRNQAAAINRLGLIPETTSEPGYVSSHVMDVSVLGSIRAATYRTDLQEIDLLIRQYKVKDLSRNNAPLANIVMQFSEMILSSYSK